MNKKLIKKILLRLKIAQTTQKTKIPKVKQCAKKKEIIKKNKFRFKNIANNIKLRKIFSMTKLSKN